MRLTLGLFFLVVSNAFASGIYSQNAKVTIGMKNASIKEVLQKIEKTSEFFFVYNNSLIDVERKVDVDVKNKKIRVVLDEIFETEEVGYVVVDKQIILSPSSMNAQSAQQQQPQEITITGTVAERNAMSLPGVSIFVKGTTTGTVSDIDGNFTLNGVANDAVLVFSFIGMQTQEIPVAGQSMFNIVMREDAIGLNEVVAIGYGTMRKSDLTGSVGSIKTEQLVRGAPAETVEALRGAIAGVNITKTNGKVGSDFSMVIRGMSSIDKSNAPLVVIDGAMGGDMNSLNPSDIEKMDILKDASSTAIYGSRGANGVIIITTKKGEKGKTKITYDGYYGFTTPVHIPDYQSADEFQAMWDALPSVGKNPPNVTSEELQNMADEKYFDWVDAVLENGVKTGHTVAMSGGGENSTHYFSVGYVNEEGNIKPEEYSRVNLKAAIDGDITDKLKVGFSSNYSYVVHEEGSDEILRSAWRSRWSMNPYDSETGELTMAPSGESGFGNALMEGDDYSKENRIQNFLGNVYAEFKPIESITLRSSFSGAASTKRQGQAWGVNSKSGRKGTASTSARYRPSQKASYTWDNTINYSLNKGDHKLNVIAGHSMAYERYEDFRIEVKDFPYNSYWYAFEDGADFQGAESNFWEWSLMSFMLRANYSYQGKYLLTLTGRRDGSSKLSEDYKWEFFPSAALAWRVSEEPFIQSVDQISNLKLRLSYGEVGNDDITPYSTQALVYATPYSFGNDVNGMAPASLANNQLEWERSKEVNIGVDLGLFNNRFSLSMELYKRETDGLIVDRAVPTNTGFNSITGNFAKTQNKGIELTLNTVNVQTKDFTWSTSINFSKNKNEILALAEDGLKQQESVDKIYGTSGVYYYREYIVGEDIMSHYFYEFDGIFQEGEETSVLAQSMYGAGAKPGWAKVVDQNGDGEITDADKKVLGTETPSWVGGMTNTFTYKNLDLSFTLNSVNDVYVFDLTWERYGKARDYKMKRLAFCDYWTPESKSNTWDSATTSNTNVYGWSKYLHNTSWVRVQNITLGYSVPKQILERWGIGKLRMYATANNPFVFSDYEGKGFDPEWANQNSAGMGVSSASYIFGVNIEL